MSGVGGAPDIDEPLAPGPERNAYAILRNRDFLYYLISRFIASFGSAMLAGVVGWEIFERKQSYLMLGYVGLVQVIPMFLFTFPAGHVADNYNRKKVIQWMQIIQCVSSLGLALVSGTHISVLWMYVFLFVMGIARTYLWSANASFMPQLVSRREFNQAVNWNSGSFQISASAGPVLGLGLVALAHNEAWVVYALNSLACLGCIGLLGLVRAKHTPKAAVEFTMESALVGLRFIFRNKVILGSISLDLFAVLLGSVTAILPAYAKEILHVGPVALGWLKASLPLGSLLMSIIMVHRPPLQKAGRTLLWSVVVFGVTTIVFGISKIYWVSFLMLFLSGMADYVSVVVRHTLVQLLTPDEMRGRVSAINNLFIGTSNEMGDFETGFASWLVGPVKAVVLGGLGTIAVVGVIAARWPQIRKYGRLDA